MAIGTSTHEPNPPPLASRVVNTGEYHQYIERKLAQTSQQLKWTDLGTAVFQWAAVLLGSLLVMAILDHWVFDLSKFWRYVCLLLLLVVTFIQLAWSVAPLLWRSINPVYAAKAIEQSAPTLKNSLINFLLFRPQRGTSQEFVLQALEQRAASDLTHVNLEHSVDRGRLIRFATIFTGVFCAAVIYQIASPKNALTTANRILAPWSEIGRPSRVSVREIQPGDAEVYFGNSVRISARISGLRRSELASVVYSTADGRVKDEAIELVYSESTLEHDLNFPIDQQGLRQDVTYRIIAGDFISPNFHLKVLPTPTIHVERVNYRFPSYTKRPDLLVENQGDLRAISGTRVTIHATTNQPIRSARLELDPPTSGNASSSAGQSPRLSPIPMQCNGTEASISFLLESSPDGKSAKFSSYQLSFVNSSGVSSTNSVIHRIDVDPDLSPEIEFLSPKKEEVDVPENGHLVVEIRALDPDFGLSSINLHIAKSGKDLLQKSLLDDPDGRSGQVIAKYDLIPSQVGLRAGDTALLWSVAGDNRLNGTNQIAEPNTARTRNIRLTITDPVRTKPSQEDKKGPPNKPMPKESPAPAKPNNSKKEGNQKSKDASSGQQKSGTSQDEQGPQAGANQADPMNAKSDPSDRQQGGAGGTESAAGAEKSAESPSEKGPGAGGQSSPSSDSSAPKSGSSSGNRGSQTGSNASSSGDANSGPADTTEPLHDGEVIEKVLQRLQTSDSKSQSGGEGASNPSSQAPQDSNAGANGATRQGTGSQSNNSKNKQEKPAVGDDRKPPPKEDGTPNGSPVRRPDKNQGAGQRKEGNPGEGGKTAHGGMEKDRGPKPEPKNKDGSEKNPGTGINGDSGAGDNSTDKTGGSAAAKKLPDVNKKLNPDSQTPDRREPPGAADADIENHRQTDSKGGASGDRAGGGKKGSMQGANQPGNDSAGQNSSSDDGAGKSNESGAGEIGPKAGDRQTSNDKTGNPGDAQGNGSGTRPNPAGAPISDGVAPQATSPKPNDASRPPQQGNQAGGARGTSSKVLGGGIPGDENNHPKNGSQVPIPDGEKANLEYARKATDMVIEYLKDQKDSPDQRLMDELKWTTADLENFVRRWEELRKQAHDEKANGTDFDDAIRSLGLRPPQDTTRQGTKMDDNRHGLRESGTRSSPPAKYREPFKAFQKTGR